MDSEGVDKKKEMDTFSWNEWVNLLIHFFVGRRGLSTKNIEIRGLLRW